MPDIFEINSEVDVLAAQSHISSLTRQINEWQVAIEKFKNEEFLRYARSCKSIKIPNDDLNFVRIHDRQKTELKQIIDNRDHYKTGVKQGSAILEEMAYEVWLENNTSYEFDNMPDEEWKR